MVPTKRTATIDGDRMSRSSWVYDRELARTVDGWELTLHRFCPVAPLSSVPVMLVHGHATSAWTFFGGPDGGIAGALAASGRDTWAVELRGSQGTRSVRGSSRVRIVDKLSVDLPTLIDHLLDRTGSDVVDAVGHSLGGILLTLCGLGRRPSRIRRLVTLAAPLAVRRSVVPQPFRSSIAGRVVGHVGRLKLSALTRVIAGRAGAAVMPHHFGANYIDRDIFSSFLRMGVTDVYGAELEEMVRWIRTSDHRRLLPKQFGPMRERLGVPTRFIVGANDSLTPAVAVAETRQAVGGRDSELFVLSRTNGCSHDYRHVDILLGTEVQRDVSPLVVDWLERGCVEALQQASA